MKNCIGFVEVGQKDSAALLDPGEESGIAALRCQVMRLHHQLVELVRVPRLPLQLGEVRQQTRFRRLQLRNAGLCRVQQWLRLPGAILSQQDFGLQELKFEKPSGVPDLCAELDALVCVSQGLSKVATSSRPFGAPVDKFRRFRAPEGATGGKGNGDEKPRRRQVVPLPPTPPPPPLPGFFSSSWISCTH